MGVTWQKIFCYRSGIIRETLIIAMVLHFVNKYEIYPMLRASHNSKGVEALLFTSYLLLVLELIQGKRTLR